MRLPNPSVALAAGLLVACAGLAAKDAIIAAQETRLGALTMTGTHPNRLDAAGITGHAADPPEVIDALHTAVECNGRRCKTRVIWAHNPNTGKPMPLDSRAPVYRLQVIDGKLTAVRDRGAFVGHHATCRDVADFSGRNRGH